MTQHSQDIQNRRVDTEDVDDIIGIASELAEKHNRELDVEDVKQIGAELGLDEIHVERAIGELRARQARAIEHARRRRRRLKIAGMAAAAVLVILAIMAFVGQRDLQRLRTEADSKRAQVRNVLDRQQATVARVAAQPDSREKDAELAGAQNRVSIERRRYDQAAAAYNASAGAAPGSWWASLFGLPGRLPLSDEIESW